jgi:hypothetical protein
VRPECDLGYVLMRHFSRLLPCVRRAWRDVWALMRRCLGALYIFMCVCVCVCMYMCMYDACVEGRMGVDASLFGGAIMCVCVCVCMYVYVYV